MELKIIEGVQLFKYKKSNEDYQNRFKLYKQVINKVLPITKTLYLGYLLFFLFNNVTNYFVFV